MHCNLEESWLCEEYFIQTHRLWRGDDLCLATFVMFTLKMHKPWRPLKKCFSFFKANILTIILKLFRLSEISTVCINHIFFCWKHVLIFISLVIVFIMCHCRLNFTNFYYFWYIIQWAERTVIYIEEIFNMAWYSFRILRGRYNGMVVTCFIW